MQTNTKKNKVIIIEDEPSHMDAMCRSFATQNGFVIKKATNLKDYYNLISEEIPNLVIADLYLPDGKAFEILSKSNASKNHYPVLITTAYGSEDIAVKAMKSGAYDYIVKSDQSFKNMYFIANKAIKEWKILQIEKEAKEALKHSYEIIKAIHKNSLLFIILVDKNLNVININEYAANFLQKNVEELTGSLFGNALNCANSLKNPKGCGYSVDCKNCEIRNTILKTFKNNRSYQKKEVSMTFLKGNELKKFNFYLSTTLIKIKEQPIVLLNILDITEQKKSERELQENEKKFRALFNSIAEGVAIINLIYGKNNKIVDFIIANENPAFSRILGMSSDEIKKVIINNREKSSFSNLFKQFITVENTGQPQKFDTFFSPNNKYFRISVVSPQKGKLACVIEDITSEKSKQEALMEKNEDMNHFLATASHNLRSPLITIKAFSGYLEEDIKKLKTPQLELKYIDYIKNAADKINILLEELISLSRIGIKSFSPKEESFQKIVKEACDLVAGRITQKKVEIIITDKPTKLFGDYKMLVELFQNLIDNAVKFMGNQKNPKIEIGVDESYQVNKIFVRDNGIGIEKKEISKIFTPFNKVNPDSEGLGMGLAIIKRIIELHKGTIYAESKGRGKGTCFYFTLFKSADIDQKKSF